MCSIGRCVCEPGFKPVDRDPDTGLVMGCEPDPNSASSTEGTVDDCHDMFTLDAGNVTRPNVTQD